MNNGTDEKKEITNMDDLMKDIREITKKQKAASRVDEIRVMKTMLNDPNFTISIYDRNKGYIGTRNPREEALKFITNTAVAITGLDNKSAAELASKYEFTKKDAMFLIDNNRDFDTTYLSTGRKLPIVQSIDSEAAIFYRSVASREKLVPSGDSSKSTTVPAYNKVICRSKCPKYHNNNK